MSAEIYDYNLVLGTVCSPQIACATHVRRPSAIVFVLVGGRPYTSKAIARETTTTYRKYFDRIAFCFRLGAVAIVLPASTSFILGTCCP